MILSMQDFHFRNIYGQEETFKMNKNAGFEGIDFSFNMLGNGTAIDLDNHIEKANESKRLLKKYGLVCNQGHAPFSLKYGEELSEGNKNFLDVVKSLEYASIIGAKRVVVHAIKVPMGEDFITYNYKYYKLLEPYAKKFGVQIAVENLLNSKFWLPAKLSGFIKMLDSEAFCACVDVGHAAIVGIEPESFISGMDKGMIGCIHMHDTDGQLDRHWIPYQGNHNWEKIIRSLVEYGFNGDMDLEIIHSFDNLPVDLYPALLDYTAKVGKYLMKKFIEIQGENK